MAKSTPSRGARALAAWCRLYRDEHAVRDLAQQLGCTAAHIHALRNGTHGPSVAMAALLLRLTGVRPEDWYRR